MRADVAESETEEEREEREKGAEQVRKEQLRQDDRYVK